MPLSLATIHTAADSMIGCRVSHNWLLMQLQTDFKAACCHLQLHIGALVLVIDVVHRIDFRSIAFTVLFYMLRVDTFSAEIHQGGQSFVRNCLAEDFELLFFLLRAI